MFKRCRVLWDFGSKIRQNYEPIQRIEALDFGTAMHKALEAYYQPTTWGNQGLMEHNARQTFLNACKEVGMRVKLGALEFEERWEELRTLGLGMLDFYFAYAPNQDSFTPKFVEVEFEVPIPGLQDTVYQGRIDLIVEDEYGYWLIDHKTTAQLAQTEWLALDDQCSSYAWAIKMKLGLEVRGVIYNELRKKAPSKPRVLRDGTLSVAKNQDTTYETYLQAIREGGYSEKAYQPMLDYLKMNARQFVRRTKVIFRPETLQVVERRIRMEALEMLDNPLIYPTPSRMNCNGCSFFAPCLALHEGRDPDTILDENYERRASA
jgi:RecB family exonuclease